MSSVVVGGSEAALRSAEEDSDEVSELLIARTITIAAAIPTEMRVAILTLVIFFLAQMKLRALYVRVEQLKI